MTQGHPTDSTKWIVVVAHDGAPSVTPFDDEGEARAFFEPAQANWSESYLCRVVRTGSIEHVRDPLPDLQLSYFDPEYTDSWRLSAFIRDPVHAHEGEPNTHGGRRLASVGDMELTTEQVRQARDWCDAWLQLYGQRHLCTVEGRVSQDAYKERAEGHGPAVEDCIEDEQGRFWVGNGEYGSQVAFCPFCGMAAPVPPREHGKEQAR